VNADKINTHHLPPEEQLIVGLRHWTEFAGACAEQDRRAIDAYQQLQCGLDHIERGLRALSLLAEEADA